MTSEMAFECWFVSRDPQVICPLNRMLDDFSITTKHFFTASKMLNEVDSAGTDLFMVDYDDEEAEQLLRQIQTYNSDGKKTVVAISGRSSAIFGADFVLQKPISAWTRRTFRNIYSRMVRDYRCSARYAVMSTVTATAQDGRVIKMAVTNIGDGGVGLATSQKLMVGDALSFYLWLPNTKRSIFVQARVLWTREYGTAGCEFLRVPPVDLDILHDWLRSKCRIKKPVSEM